MTRVIVIGGGISGLSCAFDLINSGYEVEIYEAGSVFGGQATSVKTETCYVPYAWRIWTNFYYNFLDITKRIPYGDKTVRDNLVELPHYTHEMINSMGRQIAGGGTLEAKRFPSRKSYNRLIYRLAHAFMFSDERLKEDDITFFDYMDPQDQATIDWIDEFTGPIVGMEARKVTLYAVIKGWEITYMSASITNGFSPANIKVANGPYNEVLFEPWIKYLEEKGVEVNRCTKVTNINYLEHEQKIISIDTTKRSNIVADEFVICLDQTSVNKLLGKNKELMKIPEIEKSTQLYKYGNQMYFGMVLHFSEEFETPIGTGCTPDQPWKVVIENYSASWMEEYIKKCGVAEIVQASCLDHVPGLLGKKLRDCSVEEAVHETITQLKNSDLMKTLRTKSGKLAFDTFVGYDIWPDWVNGPDGKITNRRGQYKLSINPGCWEHMPNTRTPISNLYFGSVIAKGDTPFVSMEMACSNGRTAASAIIKKHNGKEPYVYPHKGFLPYVRAPVKAVDHVLYSAGIKANMYIVTAIILLIILIVLIFVIVKIIKYFMQRSKDKKEDTLKA